RNPAGHRDLYKPSKNQSQRRREAAPLDAARRRIRGPRRFRGYYRRGADPAAPRPSEGCWKTKGVGTYVARSQTESCKWRRDGAVRYLGGNWTGTHCSDRSSSAVLWRTADWTLFFVFDQGGGPVGESGGVAAGPLCRTPRARLVPCDSDRRYAEPLRGYTNPRSQWAGGNTP